MSTTKPSNSCESSRKLTLDEWTTLYILQFGRDLLWAVTGDFEPGEKEFLLNAAEVLLERDATYRHVRNGDAAAAEVLSRLRTHECKQRESPHDPR